MALVVAFCLVAWLWWSTRNTEQFEPLGVRDPREKTFSWVPGPKGTYVFGERSSASALDAALSQAVDAYIPVRVVDGAGEAKPAPHVGSDAEDVAREALARVSRKSDVGLDLVSVEYSAVAADNNENLRYDIALMAYDKPRNVATKLALTALVTPEGKTYVRKLRVFNRAPAGPGPVGADAHARPTLAAFAPGLGIDYDRLYPV